jgi:hypothetical protein
MPEHPRHEGLEKGATVPKVLHRGIRDRARTAMSLVQALYSKRNGASRLATQPSY